MIRGVGLAQRRITRLVGSRVGRRFLLAAFSMSLVPGVIASLAWSSKSRAAIQTEAYRTLTSVADGAESAVLEYLNYLKSRALDFASDGLLLSALETRSERTVRGPALPTALNDHLALNRRPLFPECVELRVLDDTGRVVASSTASLVGEDLSKTDAFLQGRRSTHVGDIVREPDTHELSWSVSTPMAFPDGSGIVGVLVCRIDPDSLSDVMTGRRAASHGAPTQATRNGQSGETYVVNRDGLMITESRFSKDVVLKRRVESEPIQVAMDRGEEMTGEYTNYRGVHITGASMLVKELDWVILAEMDFGEALAPVVKMERSMVVFSLGLALVSILGSAYLTDRVVRPLQVLAVASDRMRAGDLGTRAPVVSNDELGSLARSFNRMAETISQNTERLETRVQERTAALSAEIAGHEKARMELKEALEGARAATTAKSDFLANMSHEIRTPMTAILGYAENLLDPDQPASERLEGVHTIRRNGEHLLGIINDILDLSKIEAGKMGVARVACEPCRIVAEVHSLVRVQAIAKGLAFDIEYIGAIPESIHSDATRLRQILINLIGNAIKFTEVGGVRLVTRLVDPAREPSLQFDVIDTGPGMTEELVGELFRPFTQANTSSTREFGGTGLGLAISKRFAGLLGGDIVVAATEVGGGTTFRATVATGPLDGVRMLGDPMSETIVADASTDIERVGPSSLHGSRILLAEDGPDNQRLISFVLKKAGANVTVKENGKLAMEAALAARDEGRPFDVILMDMQMPVMDGYEATGQLRQQGYSGPILALTAHAMAGDREKCINAGCDDYTTKPIDRKTLIAKIRKWRRKRSIRNSDHASSPDTQEMANAECSA